MTAPDLALLPLILWKTPPALEMILRQEGVPFREITDPHPLAFRDGRFVLHDGRTCSSRKLREWLSPGHDTLDVDILRRETPGGDPFAKLIDTHAARTTWSVDGTIVGERVSRFDKAALRRALIARIRDAVTRAGGVWARLASYPHPYRSAFNFRADLDEPIADDYFSFAQAREPIDDCSTHFVSTSAYAADAAVMTDLKRVDTQSHGHYHVVYRDPRTNLENLRRAHALLHDQGFACEGFAAPEGRWNLGLDAAIETLGYAYSSDFHLGYNDLPFYPWRGDRFSKVLQVPVHPICEGIFLDAGATDPAAIARHLVQTIRDRAAAGEPAFVYGHPERRLGRFPEVVSAVARAAANLDGAWRVTLTEFARWWRWRAERQWWILPRPEGKFSVQFEGWDTRYPLAMEIRRGDHAATIPITGPSRVVSPQDLVFARAAVRVDGPSVVASRPTRGVKHALRAALDWETVTPLHDLPDRSLRDQIKKRLRRWRAPAADGEGGSSWR